MAVRVLHKKFTTVQYHQMAEVGILTERDRVELIEGEIVQMSPIGRQHATCVDRLVRIFYSTLMPVAGIRCQGPIQLGDTSEPEPDIAILREIAYLQGHPGARDIFALVEVSDSTIDYDRTVKAPLYAREGVQELWIVDLNEFAIEVYRSPSAKGYRQTQTLRQGQSFSFQAFPDIEYSVGQLLVDFLQK